MALTGLFSAIRGAEPALMQIPSWWNKDWFHFVNITDHRENRCFPGYLWAASKRGGEIHNFFYSVVIRCQAQPINTSLFDG